MRAGRVSHTAIKLARVLVYLGKDPRMAPLLPADAAIMTERLLLATGGLAPWMVRLLERPWYHRVMNWIGDRAQPGLTVRMGMRKRFMDDEVRTAIAEGATQVLVIGAGFDTLCMRLAHEYPQVRFWEIDHPATAASKRAGVEALDGMRGNLCLLGVDLSEEPLHELLAATPDWDPQGKSAIVAEGVLMYLDRAAVEGLFAAIRACTARGSVVAFTYLRCDAQGRPSGGRRSRILRAALALIGESLQWCEPDEQALAEFLAAQGFDSLRDPLRLDLGARYLHPAGVEAPGAGQPIEFMALATHRGLE